MCPKDQEFDFDAPIDRRGTHCAKWDKMEAIYGVSPDTGLPMWVADTDFQSPPCVLRRLRQAVEHGVFGYADCTKDYLGAIAWWMRHRHGWEVEPEAVFTTTGLLNGLGMCLDAYTEPGDGIVLFTPVYHAFHRAIRAAGREVVQLPLKLENSRYQMDFDAYEGMLGGREKMVILCSPHNPGGAVWRRDELRALADFAKRHDLLLISDEIHHDLVYPGERHLPMALADPSVSDRLVMMTAPSKTFNLAGLHTGNVIIPDASLRARFAERVQTLHLAPNSLGQFAATAAYSPEGAQWVDALMGYLDGNRKLFDAAIGDIPGLVSMPLEATFLSWVDFSGTGMDKAEFLRRVEKEAQIAVNYGETFGNGGEHHVRFNIGTQHARVAEACARLKSAFADLQ